MPLYVAVSIQRMWIIGVYMWVVTVSLSVVLFLAGIGEHVHFFIIPL